MPSTAISSKGIMRTPAEEYQQDSLSERSEGEDQFHFIPPPPAFYQPISKANSISDRTFQSQKILKKAKKKARSVSQGHRDKSQVNVSAGHSHHTGHNNQNNHNQVLPQKTTNTNSLSTASSTDERMKEVESPILRLYEIKTRLGKGAYGIVWEAIEFSTRKKVALKKIFDGFRNSTDAQRTYREIMFLREFGHHPHMINLISVHKASNEMDLYLVFPYMDYDLHKVIKLNPHLLTDRTIRQIIYEILLALVYLHSAEVIHRDLKPANILMDQNLKVKLADFGLARSLSISPEDSVAFQETLNPIMTDYVATRWYRPPEILLNCKTYTKGVDMWSVGCILAEMLLKKPLFPGGNTNEQIEMIMKSIKVPTEEEIQDMCRGTPSRANVSVVKAGLEVRGDPLEVIFHQFDLATVDILERLMLFCPSKRLTIDEALMHPFVESVRQIHLECICDRLVRPPLSDYVKLEMEDYRQTIYEMIDNGEFASNQFQPAASYSHSQNNHVGQFLHGIPEDFLEESIVIQRGSQSGSEVHQNEQFTAIQMEETYHYNNNCYNNENFEEHEEAIEDFHNIDDLRQPHYYNDEEQMHYDENSADDNYISEDGNNNSYVNTKEIQNKWANQPQKNTILMKSHSDPTANTSFAANSNNGYNNQWTGNERTSKAVSILTLPSENHYTGSKPLTVPSNLPSQHSRRNSHSSFTNSMNVGVSMGTNTEIGDENQEEVIGDVPEIIQKFKTLCYKYDVDVGKMDALGDYKNEGGKSGKGLKASNSKKGTKDKSTKSNSTEGLYEYLPLSSDILNENKKTGKYTKSQCSASSNASWNAAANQKLDLQSKLPPLKERSQVEYGKKFSSSSVSSLSQYKQQGSQQSGFKGQGISYPQQQTQIPLQYDGDIRRIHESLGNDGQRSSSSSSKGFYNPYKPKGLKTSATEDSVTMSKINLDDGLADIYDDFEIRASLSSSHNMHKDRSIGDGMSSFTIGNKNQQQIQQTQQQYQNYVNYGHQKNQLGTNKATSQQWSSNNNNKPYQQTQGRLQELNLNKEASQDRLYQVDPRGNSKVKNSGSRESLHTSILINGKNNSSNVNRQKKTTEVAKSKFTFNRPGKKEEPQPSMRPYGGRQYDKKFHGPSFRRCGQSYSDSETNRIRSWKLNTAASVSENTLRPTSDAELIRKPMTHSAYFPNSGVTHPMSSWSRSGSNNNKNAVSTMMTTRNGFTAVHPVPSSVSNSKGAHRSVAYRYPPRSPLHPQYSSTTAYHYDGDRGGHDVPSSSGSGTIRASDLFELRNNVTRDQRKSRTQNNSRNY